MKQIKVKRIIGSSEKDIEKILNDYSAKGWEIKIVNGNLYIFEKPVRGRPKNVR